VIRERVLVAAVATWFVACARPVPTREQVIIDSRTPSGAALAGVQLLRGDRVVGETDAAGRATISFAAAGESSILLTIRCPSDYRSPDEPLRVRAAPVRALGAAGDAFATTVTCVPLREDVAVVFSTRGVPRCPVLVDGVVRGETDADGFAHVLARGAPGSVLDLEIRGPVVDARRSWRRARSFRIEDHDGIALFEAEPPVSARGPRTRLRPRRIYRIE